MGTCLLLVLPRVSVIESNVEEVQVLAATGCPTPVDSGSSKNVQRLAKSSLELTPEGLGNILIPYAGGRDIEMGSDLHGSVDWST